MIRFHNVTHLLLAATLVLTVVVGCKKSEPEPKLGEGVKLEAAGKPIDVEIGHLVPRVCDWNNDGKKDLIVGQFRDGAIRLYLNEGTDAAPAFGQSSILQAGGKPIRLDAG
ncbi:MAG: VCBS repeat-containing protein [Phycisphaerales bacterium]|nr:MAG: VCBS repeat-containing protein [Phycisphaerales bacterium]